MTLTVEPRTQEIPVVTDPVAAPAPTHRVPVERPWPQAVALTATVLLVALVGFTVYLFGLSGVVEARHQNTMYKTLSYQLTQATAPVGPVAQGTPMALLTIPAIGLHGVVVVEGTTSRDLMSGPGYAPSTPLPGQAGHSVIMGKRTTFGSPFARLLQLRVGDIITATTGQGVARYRVSSFGTSAHPAPANSGDTLVLMTANGYAHPTGWVEVSADLVGAPQPSGGGLSALPSDMQPMAGDAGDSVVPLLLWSQALLVVAVGGTVAVHRWSRWPALTCVVPVLLAVSWNVAESLSGLLPNLF
jgi:sortase A